MQVFSTCWNGLRWISPGAAAAAITLPKLFLWPWNLAVKKLKMNGVCAWSNYLWLTLILLCMASMQAVHSGGSAHTGVAAPAYTHVCSNTVICSCSRGWSATNGTRLICLGSTKGRRSWRVLGLMRAENTERNVSTGSWIQHSKNWVFSNVL